MSKKLYLISSVLIVSIIILLSFLFTKDYYLGSDSAYYGQISNQIIKDQKIVTEVANMENRPVKYPQLFFISNAVFMLFFGEFAHRIILFFVNIFIVLFLVKTFGFEKKSYNLIFLLTFSAIYFSSPIFSVILTYKIETFLFFYAIILLYLFSRKNQNISILLLFSLFVGVVIASKQFGFIFLPFIFIAPFLSNVSLKKKLQRLFIALFIVFLIISPFYVIVKASTDFFTGVSSMRLPYLDDLTIKLNSINCSKVCQESIDLRKGGQFEKFEISEDFEDFEDFEEEDAPKEFVLNDLHRLKNSHITVSSLTTSYNQFKRNSWKMKSFSELFLATVLFILLLLCFLNKNRRQIIFILLLTLLALLSYIKIATIWLYWMHASFLFEILVFFIIIYFVINLRYKFLRITGVSLLIILIFIPFTNSAYQRMHSVGGAQKVAIGLIEAKQFIPDDFYAISNRGYEPGYYLEKQILIRQRVGFDYLINRDMNRDDIWQSFWNKNEVVFFESTKIRGVNHILFIKNIRNQGLGDVDIRPAFRESLIYLKSVEVIEKKYENSEVVIYSINQD